MFDVDIAEGAPTLKLPFNVGENPYDAAERFLETNGLDPGYREQVVNFITQNVGEDAFKNAGSDLSADPFTGAGAYVPGTGGTGTTVGGGRTDPFTGAGAYVPSGTSAALPQKRKLFQFVPAKPHQCVVFPTAAFDKMLTKIQSLGGSEEELRAFAACASADETSANESEEALVAFTDEIKTKKVVVLEELAAKFGLRTADAVRRVRMLEAEGRITGIMDDRGTFIYVSREEMERVAAFITEKGRVRIAELTRESAEILGLGLE